MAPMTMHLVIGERVFPEIPQLELSPPMYGAFLLGNLLVDVHGFSDINRAATHFAKRMESTGPYAITRSCANFLGRLDRLLVRPWGELTSAEQAFVAGHLCHLAADEDWKQFDWDLLQTRGMLPWFDLPLPGDLLLIVFDVMSGRLYIDRPSVVSALSHAQVPDVWTHIPCSVLQDMWHIAHVHVTGTCTLDSFLAMLQRMGKTSAEIDTVRHQHEIHWMDAVAYIDEYFGGVRPRMEAMVQRCLETMPLLYASAVIQGP